MYLRGLLKLDIYVWSYHHYDDNNFLFFFNDTATTEIYTLSLHDALPIFRTATGVNISSGVMIQGTPYPLIYFNANKDRKSTRLNSSHPSISYAVFCLKKKIITIRAMTGVL